MKVGLFYLQSNNHKIQRKRMLRIAVQSKGRLYEETMALLRKPISS